MNSQLIRNQFTWAGPQKEKFTLPSLTVPDQTMTIAELVKRNVSSLNAKVYQGRYHDEETIDQETGEHPATLDLVDYEEQIRELDQKFKEQKDRKAEENKIKQQEQKEKELKEQEAAWLQKYKTQHSLSPVSPLGDTPLPG